MRSDATAEDERIQFRVSINSGDVIVEDGDIHGDGVNIAARLERIAEPGGICVSGIVHDHSQSYRTLAACYAHMGRLDDAREIVRKLRVISPQVVPGELPFRKPEDRELFFAGLRLAAGEAA